ncbi:hypothetical protein GGS26DRAFT_387903 [Hypomontagnella submonticulosa]|nr:hypothetical protein GGS26DRAFT_387903 [Hypomontagnella submonticulosa]
MASSQYGSLEQIQQYNQLSFPINPQLQQHQHPHPHPHPHPHQQQHHAQHHPHATHPQAQPHQHQHQHPHTQQPHHQQQLEPHPPTSVPVVPTTTYQPQPTLPPTNTGVAVAVAPQQNVAVGANTPNPMASPNAGTLPSTPTANGSGSQLQVLNGNNGTTATPNTPATEEPQRKRRRVGRPPKSSLPPLPPSIPGAPPPPPQVHVPHPLNKGPYNTADDAVFSLQLHVFTSGYGVSQKRTVKEKLPSGRYDPDGEVIRKDFACDRGGAEFVSQSTGERRRESKKCGCGWKAVVRRLKREGDLWFVEILDPQHNHPVTSPDQMHTIASYRRWQRDNNAGIRGAIERLTKAAAMPARHVAAYLKGEFTDPDLARVDRHILRALSMSDVEAPGDAAAHAHTSTVFEVVARRPTIILQEAVNSSGGGHGGTGAAGAGAGAGRC